MNLDKGLYTNGDKSNAPNGTWSMAYSYVIRNAEGDIVLTNERGLDNVIDLPINFYPIGKIPINNEAVVVFLVNIHGNDSTSNSKIIVIDRYNNITTILGDDALHDKLDFKITNQIINVGTSLSVEHSDG